MTKCGQRIFIVLLVLFGLCGLILSSWYPWTRYFANISIGALAALAWERVE